MQILDVLGNFAWTVLILIVFGLWQISSNDVLQRRFRILILAEALLHTLLLLGLVINVLLEGFEAFLGTSPSSMISAIAQILFVGALGAEFRKAWRNVRIEIYYL
jgi:lysylphosphatidylglycerol synthetase-like protein (DUF2156 family)